MSRWPATCLLLACLTLAGCAYIIQPGPAHVSWMQQSRPETTLAELEAARERFLATCTRCHGARSPKLYEPDRWDFAIRRMLAGESVEISDETIAEVVLYLSAASALPSERAVAAYEAEQGSSEPP